MSKSRSNSNAISLNPSLTTTKHSQKQQEKADKTEKSGQNETEEKLSGKNQNNKNSKYSRSYKEEMKRKNEGLNTDKKKKNEENSKYDWFSYYPELSSEEEPKEQKEQKPEKCSYESQINMLHESGESDDEVNSYQQEKTLRDKASFQKKRQLVNYINERTEFSKKKLKKWPMKNLVQKYNELKDEQMRKGVNIREFLLKNIEEHFRSIVMKLTEEQLLQMYSEIKEQYKVKKKKEGKRLEEEEREEGKSVKTRSLNNGEMLRKIAVGKLGKREKLQKK